MTRIWTRLLLLTVVFSLLSIGISFTASASGEKDWQVPSLGVFRVPQEFKAAEFPDIQKIVDSQKGKLDTTTELPIATAKDKLKSDQVDFAAYQVTMNDGQSYHLAWMVTVRDQVVMDPQTMTYFEKPLNIEQRIAAIMLQDQLNQNLDSMEYKDVELGAGFKVLAFDPFDFRFVNGKQAYAGGARFIINYQDFVFPLYVRCWLFSASGHGAAVLLVTTDSERTFWTSMLNSMVPTLRPLPLVKKK